MNDVPLIQNADVNSINTSIIAIKKQLNQISELLGLIDIPDAPDLSPYVKKADVADVIEADNMNPVTSNAVATSTAMPVNEVTANNMYSVTSGAVYSALSALRTAYGFKIGNLMIETVSIRIGTATFTNGRANFNNVYSFNAPFNSIPNVILCSQNDADYGYCTPIGIVRTETKITTLSLYRDSDGTFNNIYVKGIAIGT